MANATSTFDEYHEKCRGRVCVVCYSKASTYKSTAHRGLSENEIATIQEFIIDGYEATNPDFPCGVCVDCHLLLAKKHKDPEFQLPPREIDYEPKNRPTALRSLQVCCCRICEIAKSNGLKCLFNKPKRGRPPASKSVPVQNYSVRSLFCENLPRKQPYLDFLSVFAERKTRQYCRTCQ